MVALPLLLLGTILVSGTKSIAQTSMKSHSNDEYEIKVSPNSIMTDDEPQPTDIEESATPTLRPRPTPNQP